MTEAAINTFIDKYVKEHLSPTQDEKDDISAKYAVVCDVLGGTCFQAGSYARFTAIHPVHDLDIIYVVNDPTIKQDPLKYMRELCVKLEKAGLPDIEDLTVQTHSVTITFKLKGDVHFSIDIVPALELPERNHPYGDPLYEVPEILKMNKRHREQRYSKAVGNPIGWVKTDPRGYISAATDLNDANSSFRHATKFGKGWRHACKVEFDENYRFKSFHFEQMFFKYFTDNPGATTLEAITYCFGWIPSALNKPQFPDRADQAVFIDEYVNSLTPKEKGLIVKLQAEAHALVVKIPGVQNETELKILLEKILDVTKPSTRHTASNMVVAQTRQPWAY